MARREIYVLNTLRCLCAELLPNDGKRMKVYNVHVLHAIFRNRFV